jgi:hypothetical protein
MFASAVQKRFELSTIALAHELSSPDCLSASTFDGVVNPNSNH